MLTPVENQSVVMTNYLTRDNPLSYNNITTKSTNTSERVLMIPASLFESGTFAKLTGAESKVLMVLYFHKNSTLNSCCVSLETIKRDTGVCRQSVIKSVRNLKRLGKFSILSPQDTDERSNTYVFKDSDRDSGNWKIEKTGVKNLFPDSNVNPGLDEMGGEV